MEIPLRDEHRAQALKMQNILEYLQAENNRLSTEIAIVRQMGMQRHAELERFLQGTYGVDTSQGAYSLDAERGVVVVPDPAPKPTPEEA